MPNREPNLDHERLTDLEIKVTYQEELIETLNQCIIELRAQVDRLERTVGQLDQLVGQGGTETGPANEPPPHY